MPGYYQVLLLENAGLLSIAWIKKCQAVVKRWFQKMAGNHKMLELENARLLSVLVLENTDYYQVQALEIDRLLSSAGMIK